MTLSATRTRKSLAIRHAISGLLVAVAMTVLCAGAAIAQSKLGIAVLVNDDPISGYDVQQRLRLMTASTGKPSDDRMRKQVIDQLIDEKLMMQEAKRLNIEPPKSRVQQEINGLAKRSNMTPQQFTQALNRAGINMNSFAQRLEVRFTWPLVVQRRFARNIKVHPDDVESAMQRQGEDKKISTHYEYTLRSILFIVPKGANEAMRNSRRNMAERFRRDFRSCAETKTLLAGLPDVVSTELGKRTSDTMPAAEREVFGKLKINGTTPPRPSPNGIELIVVCNKTEITGEQVARRQAEAKLLTQEFEVLARRHLHNLKQDAVIERR